MNQPSQLDEYRWLTGAEGVRWLARLEADPRRLVAQAGRLRKDLSPRRVHLLLEQTELRKRARAKFAGAGRMFFTPLGLEQATDDGVAAYKAARFRSGERLADLCCGIGGDLLALAGRGPVVGVEHDPITALLAEANLRALGREGSHRAFAEVKVDDVSRWPVGDFAAWHLDPDRRPGGRRTTRPQLHEPGLPLIQRLLDDSRNAAIKLAPAADIPSQWCEEAELEWISRRRHCRQVVVWFGSLAKHAGRRSATIVGSEEPVGSRDVRTLVGHDGVVVPPAKQVGRYLFEPDAAVLAAGLAGTLAEEHDLAAPAPGVAYLTGDRCITDPALACFEVYETLPLDPKRLRRLLERRDIGRLEIKTRGVPVKVEEIQRRLRLQGEARATLLVAPIGGRATAIVARRVR